jgi:hypothetical protein
MRLSRFNRLLASIAFVSVALSSAHAATPRAANLSYTNVDVGIVSTELNNSSLDGDGLLLRGSVAVHQNAFVFAHLADIGYDRDIDGFMWGIGGGGHLPITSAMDLVGKIGYVRQKVDFGNVDNTESGYEVEGTVRGFVVDKLEVEAGVRHVHFQDSGNDTNLIGEGRYFFTDRIAGGVLLQLGDTTAFGINARFTF